ncbi:E3 ubiquitin-protein ligase E3D [Manis javanica]|nr:E3 ubiquitin-protein ligase E3D [Manis javanica]
MCCVRTLRTSGHSSVPRRGHGPLRPRPEDSCHADSRPPRPPQLWLLNSDSLVIEVLENPRYFKKFPVLEDIWSAVKVLHQLCIKSRNKKC